MKSDYGKWFVSKGSSKSALKCTREKFMDYLKDIFGPAKAASLFPQFRRATFAEHCSLELDLLED